MSNDSLLIKDSDRVLIVTEKRKRYLVQVREGKKFHCSEGFIDTTQLIGRPFGCRVVSNTGSRWVVLNPTLADRVMFFPRTTQVVYPKDIGYIIVSSGVGPGCRVLEGGTGTGVLTSVLAYLVKPHGKVYSYDVKDEYLEAASLRLRQLGLDKYVELKHGDIGRDVAETDLDAAIIDVPEPWKAVERCYSCLKPSGVWVSVSPTVEQVVQTFEALEETGFGDASCVELLLRNIRVKRGMTRPEFIMRGHTTFIVSARKTVKD
ncbi:MAG: tRNA (adenine-N1)-methyltransferase [Candidatus Caldarchaeum sp.]|nr:tRNA (adenine-N1)-methyltransferase [Candidatus Caldarchaeum sp.]